MNINQTCPKCGSTRTEAREEDGYVVCLDCGYWTGESASWKQAVEMWNSQPLLDRALKAERERDEALAKLEDAKIANTVHIADADLYREAEVAKHEAKIAIEERDAALAEVAKMRPVVEAAVAWLSDLTEYAELELERTARDYRDKAELAAAHADVPALLDHIEELEEKLQRALDYAKCAEACEEYEGPVRWRWTDMVELLDGKEHSDVPEVRK